MGALCSRPTLIGLLATSTSGGTAHGRREFHHKSDPLSAGAGLLSLGPYVHEKTDYAHCHNQSQHHSQ